jgi:hypothetical protein
MSPSSRPFCIKAVLRNTVLAVLRTTESASADRCRTAFSISSLVARGLSRVRGFAASRTRRACKKASCFGPESSSGGTSAAGSLAYAITQYNAKNPAARQILQNTTVPAIGWILSANEIKLVTPAIISATRQTVMITARTTMIFLALEFWAATSAFTVLQFTVHTAQSASIETYKDRTLGWSSPEVDATRGRLRFTCDEKYIPGIFFGRS